MESWRIESRPNKQAAMGVIAEERCDRAKSYVLQERA